MKQRHLILLVVFCATELGSFTQTLGFRGQLPLWSTFNPENPFQMQAGARYLPELSLISDFNDNLSFETEISANLYVTGSYLNDTITINEKLKPYRGWIRLSSHQWEIRAGLQKINFGSASLLRPLMWFDQIDPKDPLQLTDGVYGILGRYYFLNNANIWLWGLLGNDQPKGFEYFPSEQYKPELGGRIQIPFFTGEIGTTYHYRQFNTNNTYVDTLTTETIFPENRFALDLRMDNYVGFWMEGAIIYQDMNFIENYNKMLNIGIDYTFGLGNGLNMMTEFFAIDQNSDLSISQNATSFLASTLNYPISIFHNLNLMGFYYPDKNAIGSFLNFSLTYDKWSYYIISFYIPDKMVLPGINNMSNLYSGFGFQLMAVFNH